MIILGMIPRQTICYHLLLRSLFISNLLVTTCSPKRQGAARAEEWERAQRDSKHIIEDMKLKVTFACQHTGSKEQDDA